MKLCGKKCHYMDMQLFGVLDITLTTLLNTENKQMCKKKEIKKNYLAFARSLLEKLNTLLDRSTVFVLLVRPTHWARVIWRRGEECEKHLRKHELLFSHKRKKNRCQCSGILVTQCFHGRAREEEREGTKEGKRAKERKKKKEMEVWLERGKSKEYERQL